MSVLKYKDPVTGEVKKVGSPAVDTYSKSEADVKFAPMYTYGTEDIEEGSASPYENGHIHFIYEP